MGGGCFINQPFSIVASPSGKELFVTDPGQKMVICVQLVNITSGVAFSVGSFGYAPAGVACRQQPSGFSVLVAAGEVLWELSRHPSSGEAWVQRRVWKKTGADLCGVAVSDCGDIMVIDKRWGQIYSLVPRDSGDWRGGVVVGSGYEQPQRAQDGRASMVTLTKPTLACFNGRSLVFSDSGAQTIRCVTDAFTHAEVLLPQMRSIYDLYSETVDSGDHVATLLGALAVARSHSDFLDSCAAANKALAGKDGDGDFGNISKSVRDMARIRKQNFARDIEDLRRLRVPRKVILCIRPKAFTTMAVETWFTASKKFSPVLTLAEYAQRRSAAAAERVKERRYAAGNSDYSYFRGPANDRGYSNDGSFAPPLVFEHKKDPTGTSKAHKALAQQRRAERPAHDALCERLRGVRQLKPTDRGRSKQGANPEAFWASSTVPKAPLGLPEDLFDYGRSATATITEGGSSSDIVYRSGDLVLVRRDSSAKVVVAQLRFDVQRLTSSKRRLAEIPEVCWHPRNPQMRLFLAEDENDDGSDEDGQGSCSGVNLEKGVLLTATGSWKKTLRAQDICDQISERGIVDRAFDPSTRSLLSFRISRAEADRIIDIGAEDSEDEGGQSSDEDSALVLGATTRAGRTVRLTEYARKEAPNDCGLKKR